VIVSKLEALTIGGTATNVAGGRGPGERWELRPAVCAHVSHPTIIN
jgi:hypothetical protein